MQDMFVDLLKLPDAAPLYQKLAGEGVVIRRALAPDKKLVCDFVRETFGECAVGEAEASFARKPVSLFIATDRDQLVGFACYEATAPDFFGPTAVLESQRGRGVGKALLLRSLEAMRDELGYVYGIIGGVGPISFYEKCVGATLIPGSDPGIYRDFITPKQKEREND
ncbi:MAG: GNAT family N-acetyltransferase [Oscillospiraceae bacterium]|nr:GNAT family N-acetyltransferase [Oscillospiraceae bacterium]